MKTITKIVLANTLLSSLSVSALIAQQQSLNFQVSTYVPDTTAAYYIVSAQDSTLQFGYDVTASDFTADTTQITVEVANGSLTGLNASLTTKPEIALITDPTETIEYDVIFGSTPLSTASVNITSEINNVTGVSVVKLIADPEDYDAQIEGDYTGSLNLLFEGTLSSS